MCGIAVVVAEGADQEVSGMLARLAHRGPDGTDSHAPAGGSLALGHTRLAIMDPTGGHQPFVGADGAVAVTNGEIYNHAGLRAGLDERELVSGSDAAVVLPQFRRHGADLVHQLEGMYAIVVAGPDGQLTAIRDRLGIKPLYRARRGGDVAFASELKALTAAGWPVIETVPPGHAWVGDRIERYYEAPPVTEAGATDDAAVEYWCAELRRVLEQAVVRRLMSDVPLGSFLSGGLDSSIVTALAARHVGALPTFALGFAGSADLTAARQVARHLGTTHHEIVVGDDEPAAVLPEVLYHLESWDRDLVRSALPSYLVARFAAEEVTVVLTGEGADELFAGYRYHAAYADEPATLQHELRRALTAMHDSNLQRVDRMTMAHALEARVPFLDPAVVEVASQIPAELKLRRGPDGRLVEKWILRRAFADLLPPEIVWRTKSQFDEGSGAVDRLPRLAAEARPGPLPSAPGAVVRDVEEAWYFDQLRESLGDWQAVAANTSVWAHGRIPLRRQP